LYWYRSRFYDQSLGRFIQPDTLVPNPGDPVAFDRYHYSKNSPVNFKDPSGHQSEKDESGSPIITYDEENGICINSPNLGCSGGNSYREWHRKWYRPNISGFIHQDLAATSFFAQDVALGASTAGAGCEFTGFTVGGPAGAVAGNSLHQITTNNIESVASWTSTSLTIVDDLFFKPEDGIYVNDEGALVISDASVTSFVASVVGGVIPVASIDALIDAYISSFNRGLSPGIFEMLGINGDTLFGIFQFGE
jgi:hypothetical protein